MIRGGGLGNGQRTRGVAGDLGGSGRPGEGLAEVGWERIKARRWARLHAALKGQTR